MMAGVVLRHDGDPEDRIGHRVCMAIRSHGVVLRNLGDVMVLMPPLAMTPAQIRQLGDALALAMVDVLG